MFTDALQHCKGCPQCCIVSGGRRPAKAPLQPIPVSQLFQILGIDVRDLPQTERGNKHVLVIHDFLTKWPLVFPIPDQKTSRIVEILVQEIIPLCGVSECLQMHKFVVLPGEGCLFPTWDQKAKHRRLSPAV